MERALLRHSELRIIVEFVFVASTERFAVAFGPLAHTLVLTFRVHIDMRVVIHKHIADHCLIRVSSNMTHDNTQKNGQINANHKHLLQTMHLDGRPVCDNHWKAAKHHASQHLIVERLFLAALTRLALIELLT